MNEKDYYSIWTNYFKNQPEELEKTKIVFNNFKVNSEWFLKLPQITKKGILFSDDFGYSSFNELTVLKICQEICYRLFRKMNLFIAFDKGIKNRLKNNVIRLFSQFGHVIYTYPETFELDENTVRRAFMLNKFNGGIYFKFDDYDKKWYLKIFDNEGYLLDARKQANFLNKLIYNDKDIILSSEIRINELSYNKVFYLENNEDKYFDKFSFHNNKNFIIDFECKVNRDKINLTNLFNNLGFLNNQNTRKKAELIWHLNSESQVSAQAMIKNKLVDLSTNDLIFIYSDYMRHLWEGKKILLPLNTTEEVILYLEKNKIDYIFEDELCNEKDIIFYASANQFSSGYDYSFSLNNIDFIANLTYLLGAYSKKNNLLDSKIDTFHKEYGLFSSEKLSYSFNLELESELDNIFRVNQAFTKNLFISEITRWTYEDIHNKFIYKIKLNDSSVLKIWYKKKQKKLNILVESFNDPKRNFLTNQFKFQAIKNNINKIVSLIKK